MNSRPFKPLVVGAPRSGFALLASVVIHFVPYAPNKADTKQRIFNALISELGNHISTSIIQQFSAHGITNDLLYNPNFRYIVGGPKWLSDHRPDYACFRKYIGVRGMGDFTLITSHPRQVLDMDEVVHSHSDPGLWLNHPGYSDYTKFASVRNPVGILNSSVFSLNALASEYIQKFVPEALDTHEMREQLALYKFTDLNFFEGLVRFLAGYLEEFIKFKDRYVLMKWEDLILEPIPTILRLAKEANINFPEEHALQLWEKIDHVNLTQAHKHNYRKGKGIVGDWKNWITNEHLAMMKLYGFDRYMIELGYGPIEFLNPMEYTPFQQKVSDHIEHNTIYREFFDPDLFMFAFNKSNLVSDKFPFRRHDWREWTQIERSIFSDEALERKIWDVAEESTGQLNAFIEDYLKRDFSIHNRAKRHLRDLNKKFRHILGRTEPEIYRRAFEHAEAVLEKSGTSNSILDKMTRPIWELSKKMALQHRWGPPGGSGRDPSV